MILEINDGVEIVWSLTSAWPTIPVGHLFLSFSDQMTTKDIEWLTAWLTDWVGEWTNGLSEWLTYLLTDRLINLETKTK